MKRAVLYLRVSTLDQTTANQERELREIPIPPKRRGGWRVEEEFVNAVRGIERVTHTDFFTGVKYMEWTTAVSRSLHKMQAVMLPIYG